MDALIVNAHAVRGELAPRPESASEAARGGATLGFRALPPAVVLRVFALMPADARARAALVCRAWRDAIAEPSLWTRLDLSPASGVTVNVTDAVLRGAAARARGQLTIMAMSGYNSTTRGALLEVLALNAGSLRELHWLTEQDDDAYLSFDNVQQLLHAAPHLDVVHADVGASFAHSVRMLRNEAPYQALRIRAIEVTQIDDEATDADVFSL